MYKLIFYVPNSHLEKVKEAVFAKGAGRVGNYDCCCWQVCGEGQYRPLPGSKPFIGAENKIEKVEEYRVEMVCQEEHIAEVVTAMKKAHPYEEPAYSVTKLVDISSEDD